MVSSWLIPFLPQFGHVDSIGASFLDASRSGGCSGAVFSGSAVLVDGVDLSELGSAESGSGAPGPPLGVPLPAIGLGDAGPVARLRRGRVVPQGRPPSGVDDDVQPRTVLSLWLPVATPVTIPELDDAAGHHRSSHIHGQHHEKPCRSTRSRPRPVMIDPDPVNP